MSRAPDNLDPFTLRWLADEKERDAKRNDDFVVRCNVSDAPSARDAAEFWSAQATRNRSEAKRLRGLATRVERRRGRR